MPFAVVIHKKGGQPRRQEFDKNEVTIGRVQGNDIVLPKQNVSNKHSRIVVRHGKFIIVDLKSTNGTYVNGHKIASPMVVKETDKIYIGGLYSLRILSTEGTSANPVSYGSPPASAPSSQLDSETVPPVAKPRARVTAPNPISNKSRKLPAFDVFLSHKSEDYLVARRFYVFLRQNGKNPFLSEESLPNLGASDYQAEIDRVLEQSKHMVVIGSSVANITSGWVASEWRAFINELRAGRKSGNVLTLLIGEVSVENLPLSLRSHEVMPYRDDLFSRALAYLD